MSTEEWIKKSINKHGTEYNYDKVNYVNGLTKVCIICPKHGEFWQLPNNHIKGCGCPKCSTEKIHNKQRNNVEKFIEKANKIHNNKYDYSLVHYHNNETKVKIICPIHGIFEQKPSNHITGQGCPKCAKELSSQKQMMTLDEFIQRAKIKHNNFYSYDKSIYNGSNEKLIITCPIHGDFEQTPSSHLNNNSACPICGRIKSNNYKKLTLEKFIEKANKIHNNKYDYSKVKYVDYNTPVIITCPTHGEFFQTPDSHLQGKGCSICSNNISKIEDEINNLIQEKGLLTEKRNRTILDGKELDIYIPSKKIAIEYNGLYWHSEEFGKDKNYHLNKLIECNKKGIKLIQIFEDEYVNHKEIVLNKLYHLLNINLNLPKIYGRKCNVSEIKYEQAKEFLNKFHIQGFASSSIYLGAYYNEELIAVMSFKREKNNDFELTRFASDYNYICCGVGGKLFSYFVKNYNAKTIKSFADRRWTINEKNNVYLQLGFKFDSYIRPNYTYFMNKCGIIRQHKFNFRKQILHKKYGLPLSMTESEMTSKLGYYKIWDCGLIKYVWLNE